MEIFLIVLHVQATILCRSLLGKSDLGYTNEFTRYTDIFHLDTENLQIYNSHWHLRKNENRNARDTNLNSEFARVSGACAYNLT